jgi:predicted glutamine amidotransferase
MCRFIAYLGPRLPLDALVTRPRNSLIHQSFHSEEREEPLNGDGFGLAWWKPDLSPEPALFRSVSPAWSNRNLLELARVTNSECVLAHVRAATDPLSASEQNCHPFASGRFAFMHNGDLAGFAQLRRHLLARLSDPAFHVIRGTTDSEHLFALFVDALSGANGRAAGGAGDATAEMVDALQRTITSALALVNAAGVGEASYLNCAVADGRSLVACRCTDGPPADAETLYYHAGARYVCEGDLARLVTPGPDDAAVIVASEPLTDDPGWQEVPVNHCVVVHPDRRVELVPLVAVQPRELATPSTYRLSRRTGMYPKTRRLTAG